MTRCLKISFHDSRTDLDKVPVLVRVCIGFTVIVDEGMDPQRHPESFVLPGVISVINV